MGPEHGPSIPQALKIKMHPDSQLETGRSCPRGAGASSSVDAPSPVHKDTAGAFSRLPPEIRNMIYRLCLHFPDFGSLYSTYDPRSWGWHRGVAPRIPLGTPTLLLLCKSITAECLGALRSQKLVIKEPPPCIQPCNRRTSIHNYISARTLQSLWYIEFRIIIKHETFHQGRPWADLVDEVASALREQTAAREVRFILDFHEDKKHPVCLLEDRALHAIWYKVCMIRIVSFGGH